MPFVRAEPVLSFSPCRVSYIPICFLHSDRLPFSNWLSAHAREHFVLAHRIPLYHLVFMPWHTQIRTHTHKQWLWRLYKICTVAKGSRKGGSILNSIEIVRQLFFSIFFLCVNTTVEWRERERKKHGLVCFWQPASTSHEHASTAQMKTFLDFD